MSQSPQSLFPPLPPPMRGVPKSHPPCLLVCLPVICRVTLHWKLLRVRSVLGVSTHVSSPNNNTAWVTALKMPRRLQIRPLPAQNPQQLPPNLPRLLKVAYHFRSVIITFCHRPSQIPEHRHIIQRVSIGLKGHL